MKQLIQRLTDTFGPSGHENAVRDLIRKEVRGLTDEMRVDALGNLIVHKRATAKRAGQAAPRRIMIAAHMDEIGLAVTHVDPKGFVRFTSIGGIYPRNLPGSQSALPERHCGRHRVGADRDGIRSSRNGPNVH